MKIPKKLFLLLNRNEKIQSILILILISIMALLEMIGIASILPFMAVLTNPNLIETNLILNKMFETSYIFGVNTNQHFLFALGVIVFLMLIISQIFKIFTTYIQVRFIYMREYTLGKSVLENYLHQPYSWFLNRHSAELGKTILSEVQTLVFNGMLPLMELIAKGTVTIALVILLIIVDPSLAIIIGISLAGAYSIIFYFVRNYLRRNGEKRLINNQLRFKAVSEAFAAAKEVKVGGLENTYIKSFSNSSRIYAQAFASQSVVSQLPRYVLEAIGFGGILLMILYMMVKTGNFNNSLPVISLYVFAGYRLLPALQQMYSAFVQLTFIEPSLDKLSKDIESLKPISKNQNKEPLSFKQSIKLKNVYFCYPNSSRNALINTSLNIPSKSKIGLIGSTGSGKTTLVDIILGLLEPQKGHLEVDGKIITRQNARSWQKSIGYVPQHIYLSDDTISANIAFGVKSKYIDQKAVEKASKIANLHEFIIKELPNNYQTTIGERGVKLSGGQRQRIGIARAIYHNPKILILDEATSALDNYTEKAVMDAINNLSKDITIIVIAHRLNTIKMCDTIFKIDKGQVISHGTYDELINQVTN